MRIDYVNWFGSNDTMTAEERAVIEAAERWTDSAVERGAVETSDTRGGVIAAVRALRASRQPKPRYYYNLRNFGGAVNICDSLQTGGASTVATACSQLMADHIITLLNERDAKERG